MQGAAFKLLSLSAVIIVTGCVTACTNVAVSGAQAIYNHKSLTNNVNDTVIALKATHVLNRPRFKDTNISIAALNSEVLLSGEVPEDWQKEQAGELVKNVDGVKQVYNMLRIAAPASGLSQASDSWVTAKVKSKIIACRDIDATRIKVVTENGTVYLMGALEPDEAEAAVDIASNTFGATSVVKLFSYIKITKNLS